ncbi:GDSL-type esterase/lipase family protein [Microbacterium sp. Kw_RZR3]|uniref:SGNH/GDSL hydrolase family protein n=1 Tax=Microbacterium sp. Kw_RZR3 TaxID=3032903 RepID=UPI0023DC0042|nr:GDSL-type esterase/lipase family protein [Microbacterium sp. Kw_RZR3]MDF2045168.1 GDSL-type esterase/lipase family protein [Microbacterium sp. Kw_RZR3]
MAPYAIRPGVKAVFLGDSITHRSNAAADRGWVDQLPRILGTSVIAASSVEAGVPGETSAAMLARYGSAVRANGAQVLFLLAGTNDAGQGRTLAQFAASIKGIAAEARRDGVPLIIGTTPPLGASRPAADKLRVQQYIAWLTAWAPTAGVVVADVYRALVANGSEAMVGGYDDDGIHPNTLGHQKIAEAFAAAFTSRFTAETLHPVQAPSAFNLVANPLFAADFASGWFNPGGGSGAAPTNTVEADSTGKLIAGQWGKIALDATGQASFTRRSYSITGLTPGDKLLVTARTHLTDATGGILAAMQGAAPTADASLRVTRPNLTTVQNLNGPAGVLNPGPIMRVVTVPAGETSIYLTAQFSLPAGQSGAFRIGEVGVFNVTNLPDLAALYA